MFLMVLNKQIIVTDLEFELNSTTFLKHFLTPTDQRQNMTQKYLAPQIVQFLNISNLISEKKFTTFTYLENCEVHLYHVLITWVNFLCCIIPKLNYITSRYKLYHIIDFF